jgi:hypothetical protein
MRARLGYKSIEGIGSSTLKRSLSSPGQKRDTGLPQMVDTRGEKTAESVASKEAYSF